MRARGRGRSRLLKYPEGAVNSRATPKIFCVSLGKYDGSLCFDRLVINGRLAAIMKHVLEVTKVACCREQPASMAFWSFADVASNVLSRLVFAA